MRVCSIINSLTTGGAEVLVSALSAEFARLGDRALVVALCDAETVGNSAETEARMAEQIRSVGADFLSLGLSSRRNPLMGAIKLRAALRGFEPDIIHCHTVRALPMATIGLRAIPTVLTHHNTHIPFPTWLFKVFDQMTQGYVAIGAEVEEILRRHASGKIVRIPNAANRSFTAGVPRTLAQGVKSILSVGTISEQKNYRLILDVASALKAARSIDPLPVFRIAGGGADLQKLRAQTKERALDDIVEFLGERSDVPKLMQESDLYLNVSLFEGMPLTLLEAMASGLPIVATDVPGNRELVHDNENGKKPPLGDANAIAQSVCEVLEDPDLHRKLSVGSLEKSREFSIDRTASKHRILYKELADQNRDRSWYPPKEVAEREPSTPQ